MGLDPISIGMIALGTASLGTGIAGAAMAPGTPSGRLKLPPELEMAYLRRSQKDLNAIDDEITRSRQVEAALNKKLNIAEAAVKGAMPDERFMAELEKNAFDMAKVLGGNMDLAIKRGWVDPLTVSASKRVQEEAIKTNAELRALASREIADPQLEKQLSDEKQRLQETLIRQGVSPAQQQIALAQFDQAAKEARFTRREQLLTGETQRQLARLQGFTSSTDVGAGIGERQLAARFSGIGNLYGQQQGIAMTGAGQLASIAGMGAEAGFKGIETRSGLVGQAEDIYGRLGQFDFSGHTKDALESGLVGPGSIYEQTGGISRNRLDTFKDITREYQNQAADARLAGIDLGGEMRFDRYSPNYSGNRIQDIIERSRRIAASSRYS